MNQDLEKNLLASKVVGTYILCISHFDQRDMNTLEKISAYVQLESYRFNSTKLKIIDAHQKENMA